MDNNNKGKTLPNTNRLTAIIRPLTPATNYYIRVTSENRIGESDFSEMKNIRTAEKRKCLFYLDYLFNAVLSNPFYKHVFLQSMSFCEDHYSLGSCLGVLFGY